MENFQKFFLISYITKIDIPFINSQEYFADLYQFILRYIYINNIFVNYDRSKRY